MIDDERAVCETVATADEALRWFRTRCDTHPPSALGVDTLTLWSTGPAGWRPADRALRAAYPRVVNSIASPNSLYGAMPVSGAAVALALRDTFPDLKVTETHPKVLYFCLARAPYDFDGSRSEMVRRLAGWIGLPCEVGSEHGWDALVSAHAAREWHSGRWTHDLHRLPARAAHEHLVPAHGCAAHYAWPTVLEEALEPAPQVKRSQGRAQRRPDRWKLAVERLEDAGHDDVAKLVSEYRNARGERAGWDSWLRSNFPRLWPLIEGDDE
jgi:hypothetical protein